MGDRIIRKFFVNNKPIWKLGIITQKHGHFHYTEKLDERREVKRRVNQLQKSDIQKEKLISN